MVACIVARAVPWLLVRVRSHVIIQLVEDFYGVNEWGCGVVWWLSIYYSVLSIQQKQYIVSAMFVIVIISKDIVTLLSHTMSFASSCGNYSSVTIKPSHLISSLYSVPLPIYFSLIFSDNSFKVKKKRFQVRTNPLFTRTLSNQMCF